MKEQYERALEVLANKMEEIGKAPLEGNHLIGQAAALNNLAKAMEKLGRGLIALKHFETMDEKASVLADSIFGDVMKIRKN